jgi:hypothetical protein
MQPAAATIRSHSIREPEHDRGTVMPRERHVTVRSARMRT